MPHVEGKRAYRQKLVLATLLVVSVSVIGVAGSKVWTRARVVRLVEQLNDESPEVREAAAESLARIGEPSISMLQYFLCTYPDGGGEDAAHVLAAIGPAAVPALIECLSHGDARVRAHATTALGHIGPDAAPAVPDLSRLLRDESPRVRTAAETTLIKIGRSRGLMQVFGNEPETAVQRPEGGK